MTILRVHDIQQTLTLDFVKKVQRALQDKSQANQKKDQIYLMGQEMGFCNDEIEILLEDVLKEQ